MVVDLESLATLEEVLLRAGGRSKQPGMSKFASWRSIGLMRPNALAFPAGNPF